MSGASSIEWTDATWNPVRGCSRVSEGCRNCYAERHAARFSDEGTEMNDVDGHMHGALPFAGFAKNTPAGPRWTGEVALVTSALDWPLRKTKPLRIFVNSMSDLFHEKLSDESIAAVFGAMAACPQHTFQILTKRPEQMRPALDHMLAMASGRFLHPALIEHAAVAAGDSDRLFAAANRAAGKRTWPLPNVWLGTSVENQATADERIPHLLATPAAKHFVSYEPALGPVNFCDLPGASGIGRGLDALNNAGVDPGALVPHQLDWVIVGGESGPGARPFDVAWARSTVKQCKAADVACFVKQMGAKPYSDAGDHLHEDGSVPVGCFVDFEDRKGGDWDEWPEDLRVREFPR